jgi:hypothetical protein
MMNPLVAVSAVLVLCTFVVMPQTRPAAPAATGVVSGAVTSAETNQPLRRATVRLNSASPVSTRSATTDGEGKFVITGVPAGTYTLSASKPGYLDMVLGARRPGVPRAGTLLQIAAAQKIEHLELKLPRGGVISGTITDEFGDLAFNTTVRVLRYVYDGGRKYATTFGQQDVTDDRGNYRIAGLMPGEYIVSAVPKDVVSQAMAARDMQRERFAAALAAARASGSERPLGMRPDAAELLSQPIDPTGYVPVHYPGSVLPGGALAVRVAPGEEVANINIQLQVVHTANVTGTVSWSEGAVPAGARIQLVDLAMPMPTLGSWWTGLGPGGRFIFYGVAPGSYLVRVHTSIAGTDLYAFEDVQVDPARTNDVELRLQRGMSVSGTVALEGAPVALARLRVVLYPVVTVADPEMGAERVALDAAGRFVFRGLLPARYRFVLEGLPAGWSLASAIFGERDAADYLVEIEPGRSLSGGVLKLTSKSADLAGVVTTTTGQPASDGLVLVFPEDRRLWVAQSRRIHTAALTVDGRYAVRDLPPGDYRVVVADPEPQQWFDVDYLASLLPAATAVTVGEGEKKQQDLRVK